MGLRKFPQIVFAADWLLQVHLSQLADEPGPQCHAQHQCREGGQYRAKRGVLKHPQRREPVRILAQIVKHLLLGPSLPHTDVAALLQPQSPYSPWALHTGAMTSVL